ncbi:hypothetical protein DYB31_009594 [Aphanomyces astaci]|uniref:Uncharacterized protein n=1 Tax=Aphanomyces astaci TaxID=112090 RepID=A0A397EV49_APHAT|nr:hypothetical protein DYB31_009594 [Aphanomyces astaci]
MGYPASGVEKTYRNDVSDVSSFLNMKHQDKYFIYNLSEREYGISIYHKSDQDLLEYVQMVNGIFWKKRGQGVRYPSQARYVYYFTKVHPAPSEHVPSKLLYNSAWDTPQLQSYTDPHTTLVFRQTLELFGVDLPNPSIALL